MLMISEENRLKLIQALETEMPSLQPPLRQFFSLMLVLLHDQQRMLDGVQVEMRNATHLIAMLKPLLAQVIIIDEDNPVQ